MHKRRDLLSTSATPLAPRLLLRNGSDVCKRHLEQSKPLTQTTSPPRGGAVPAVRAPIGRPKKRKADESPRAPTPRGPRKSEPGTPGSSSTFTTERKPRAREKPARRESTASHSGLNGAPPRLAPAPPTRVSSVPSGLAGASRPRIPAPAHVSELEWDTQSQMQQPLPWQDGLDELAAAAASSSGKAPTSMQWTSEPGWALNGRSHSSGTQATMAPPPFFPFCHTASPRMQSRATVDSPFTSMSATTSLDFGSGASPSTPASSSHSPSRDLHHLHAANHGYTYREASRGALNSSQQAHQRYQQQLQRPTSSPVSSISHDLSSSTQPSTYGPPSSNLGPENSPSASLDDLSIAAFLQTLDTLEIAPSDGLTSSMLASVGPGGRSNSAILADPGVSFAVPADFSWWDLGLGMPDGAIAPAAAAGATVVNAQEQQGQGQGQRQEQRQGVGEGQQMQQQNQRFVWPRGAESGMGQGMLRTSDGEVLQGGIWPVTASEPTREHIERRASPTSDAATAGQIVTSRPSASASISASASASATTSAHDADVKISSANEEGRFRALLGVALGKSGSTSGDGADSENFFSTPTKSCCSKPSTNAHAATNGNPKRSNATASHPASASALPRKSCCGSKDEPASTSSSNPANTALSASAVSPLTEFRTLPNPQTEPPLSAERERVRECTSTELESTTKSPSPSRVHCVPNPSGKGCTCLCDMSVALLSVRRTLRQAHSPPPPRTRAQQNGTGTATDPEGGAGAEGEKGKSRDEASTAAAATTLHLTLSASQAVAAQCACSADCPTCRSDPSTEMSASILVSTALQIYARE